jgi:shikimate dehydrogenase
MQNAGIEKLGLDWRYLAFDVHPDALRQAISGAVAMKFIGLNLTVPHKLLALDMMDELDESARMWGAVNTVLFEAQEDSPDWKPLRSCDPERITATRTRGFNTDADAIVRSIQEDLGIQVRGSAILILGAGGAGRTAALKLAQEGAARLFLVNRTASKAAQMRDEINRRFPDVTVDLGYPPREQKADLVLNATSLGLKPGDSLPFSPEELLLKNCRAAYDMIYRPAETPFLKEARAAGCRTSNGLGMLLYQGAKALEIWSEVPAPIDAMRDALRTSIYGKAHT